MQVARHFKNNQNLTFQMNCLQTWPVFKLTGGIKHLKMVDGTNRFLQQSKTLIVTIKTRH